MGYDYRANTVLAEALAYWKRKRSGRSMPSRQNIDPCEVPKLLPHLQLIDVIDGRFRYRLIGTALVEAFGRNNTGRYPEEIVDARRAALITDVYRCVLKERRPMFLRSRYITSKDVDLIANRIYLPLSDDDEAVNMILGAMTFEFATDRSLAGVWGSAKLTGGGAKPELVDIESGD